MSAREPEVELDLLGLTIGDLGRPDIVRAMIILLRHVGCGVLDSVELDRLAARIHDAQRTVDRSDPTGWYRVLGTLQAYVERTRGRENFGELPDDAPVLRAVVAGASADVERALDPERPG